MSLRSSSLGFVLLTCALVPLHSQTTAPDTGQAVTTIKTKVHLVLVDVVVTNNKGEPVSGLRTEDFEVLEDGKPQTISTFEEHRGAAPTQIKLPPMPPNVYTNFPLVEKADSLNVLLLDSLNTPAPDQVYVHSQMIKHLKDIPANTRVAVFTLASRLRMVQGVTTDSSALLAAVNQQNSRAAFATDAIPNGERRRRAARRLHDAGTARPDRPRTRLSPNSRSTPSAPRRPS